MENSNDEANGEDKSVFKVEQEYEDVTIDFVVEEANKIWKSFKKNCKEENIKRDDTKKLANLLGEYHKNNKAFADAYPLVLRYMIELGWYDAKTFRKFLGWLEKHPYNSQEEQFDSMAKYAAMLYRAKTPHYNPNAVAEYERIVRKNLQVEYEEFKTKVEALKDAKLKECEEMKILSKERCLEIVKELAANYN